jgi:hypothetical protein
MKILVGAIKWLIRLPVMIGILPLAIVIHPIMWAFGADDEVSFWRDYCESWIEL